MRRVLCLILIALLLSACARPGFIAPPSARPTSAAPEPTSAALADRPPAMSAPVAPTELQPTTVPATPAPIDAPTAPPVEPTTSAPAEPTAPAATPAPQPSGVSPLSAAPLNPQDQAPALLPELRGDLAGAGRWNRYTISAEIDPQARTIAGHERLEYTNRDDRPLDRLYLHLYPNLPDFAGRLTVDTLAVDGQAVQVAYERQHYLLRVDLPQPLAPGAATVVTLDFAARAPENASARAYGAFNKEIGVLALASSYPLAAIVRDGVWDIAPPSSQGDFVNSETSLYDVTLAAPDDWALVTTGVTVDQRREGGRQTLRIVSGPQRDFTICATQLAHASTEVEGTRVNSYYRPEDEDGGRLALETAMNALRTYNARFGRYPLAEIDVVEIAATQFLGVEYPGLVMIEHRLYGRPDTLETTVAHEMAHQWWYSQIGNDVQTEAWVDEALASYSQIVYDEAVHGGDAAEQQLQDFRQRYLDIRAAGRDAPVEQLTAAFSQNYVSLVYGKAVLFFQALREKVGEAAFDRFLHDYYASHRYGFVAGADLLASAEGTCGCDLHPLYHDWIETTAPVELP